MSGEPDIVEGARVKVDRADAGDTWFVVAITGDGEEERIHLVHAEHAEIQRAVCRDRVKLPAGGS